jgi:pimeloyl-ACP methyl ester carboxylesterase
VSAVRTTSRRSFLRTGAAWLAGAASLGAAGCTGRGPEGAIFSEPEGTDAPRWEVEIRTPRGAVRGMLHAADGARGTAVLVSGAGGGVVGPSGVYAELSERLRADGVTALRLDYRKPNDLPECVYDVLASLDALGRAGVERAVLVGWSFGGAVVISAGSTSERVVGVATVASQTYGTEDVGGLSPEKALLLIHGTADRTLPAELSRHLYARAAEPKELVLYPGDGHGVERHRSQMLVRLHGWSRQLLLDDA